MTVSPLRALHLVIKRVHASLDLGETLDAVADGVVAAAGFEVAALNLLRPEGGFVVVSVAGDPAAREALLGTVASEQDWHELVDKAEHWGGLWFVDHRNGLPAVAGWVPDIPVSAEPGAWHPEDSLLAPLLTPGGDLIGILSVDRPTTGRMPEPGQREILELFADHAAIAITHARLHSELAAAHVELNHRAGHDPLTGLANRSLMRTRVDMLMEAHGVRIGVLVVDLDGFKQVNDEFGHEAGDEVLRAVSERMAGSLRESDLLVRSGGDEFVVILTAGDGDERVDDIVPPLVARLRAVVAEPVDFAGRTLRVEASIGVAFGETPCEFSALVAAADAEMYRIKRARRTAP